LKYFAGIFQTLFVLSIFCTNGNAQKTHIYQGIYNEYQGIVGKRPVNLTVVVLNDSLISGTISDISDNENTHQVSGFLRHNKEFEMTELDEKKVVYKGTFSHGIFEGNASVGSKKKIPFTFTEIVKIGSVKFKVYTLESELSFISMESSPKCNIKYSLLYPDYYENAAVSDSLKKMIGTMFFNNAYDSELYTNNSTLAFADPAKLLRAKADSTFRYYREVNSDTTDTNYYSYILDWDFDYSSQIVYNADGLLSMGFSVYFFTGGAHGGYGSIFRNIDLRSGKTILLKDLFLDNSDNALSAVIASNIKKNWEYGNDTKLTDIGYFEETVSPVENFYLTEKGIGFHYNPYEIGPYAIGATDVFIPYMEIETIVKKENWYFIK
jgi:hypothetical protein